MLSHDVLIAVEGLCIEWKNFVWDSLILLLLIPLENGLVLKNLPIKKPYIKARISFAKIGEAYFKFMAVVTIKWWFQQRNRVFHILCWYGSTLDLQSLSNLFSTPWKVIQLYFLILDYIYDWFPKILELRSNHL